MHDGALPSKRLILATIAILFVAGLGVYGTSLKNSFVHWDDGLLIYEKQPVRELSAHSVKTVFTSYDPELYIPLTFVTYQINYALVGLHPFLYHLTNLVLHLVSSTLLAWILWMLLDDGWLAGGGALLFALHPLNVEAVAWASARKDVLAGMFFFASIAGYLVHRRTKGKTSYWLSVLCFFLGLLSKVSVILLPAILLLLDWREHRSWTRKMLIEKLPYFALSLIFGVVAIFGKADIVVTTTLLQKILMAGRSTVFYLWKFVFPHSLTVLYPVTEPIGIRSAPYAWSWGIVLLLAGLLLWSLRRSRAWVFGTAVFLVLLAPSFINFAKNGDLYVASDRYAYLPMVGLVWIVLMIFRHVRSTLRPSLFGFGILLLGTCGWLAHAQSLTWKNTQSLFTQVLKVYPNSYIAHNNLGNVRRQQGDLEGAVMAFQAALATHPDSTKVLNNLAATERERHRDADALALYDRIIALDPTSPDPHYGLALLHAARGRLAEAEKEYRRVLAIDPKHVLVWNNLGSLLVDMGRTEEGVSAFQKALSINPYFVQAYHNLAVVAQQRGDTDEALQFELQAIAAEADSIPSRLNLAILYAKKGMFPEARAQVKAVLAIDPSNTTAREFLRKLGM